MPCNSLSRPNQFHVVLVCLALALSAPALGADSIVVGAPATGGKAFPFSTPLLVPNGSTFVVPLSPTREYIPSTGNLLLDITNSFTALIESGVFDDWIGGSITAPFSRAMSCAICTGTSNYGLVTGFTFTLVPEPSSLFLFVASALAGACVPIHRRRKSRPWQISRNTPVAQSRTQLFNAPKIGYICRRFSRTKTAGIFPNPVLRMLMVMAIFGCCRPIQADPFVYANGVFTTITIPGVSSDLITPRAINDAGVVVGTYADSAGGHGFLDNNGTITPINVPSQSGFNTGVSSINNGGQTVGDYLAFPYENVTGFLYSNGTFSTLNLPAGAMPTGINNLGQIVGFTYSGPAAGAFLYANGNFILISSDPTIRTAAINDAGQIVGLFAADEQGFLYSNGVFSHITFPGASVTVSNGINNLGEIAGYYLSGSSGYQGFLDLNGTFITINAPDSASTQIFGVNDSGDFVGLYTTPPPPAPEPSSLLLFASGFAGICVLVRTRLTSIFEAIFDHK